MLWRLHAIGMDLLAHLRYTKKMTEPSVMTVTVRTMANKAVLLARPMACFMGEMHATMMTKEEGRRPMILPSPMIMDLMVPIPIAMALP